MFFFRAVNLHRENDFLETADGAQVYEPFIFPPEVGFSLTVSSRASTNRDGRAREDITPVSRNKNINSNG